MTQDLRPFHGDRYVRMLFRQLPGAIWATDRTLTLTYIAGRLANDMSPLAKPGMSVYAVLGTDSAAHPAIAAHYAAMGGKPQSFEYYSKDRWYAVFIEQLTGDADTVLGCIGSAFDITDQRATQERLTSREALLAQSQRVAHVGSFEWEMSTNTMTLSDELYRIFGFEPGGFIGTYEGFLKRIHPDDLAMTKIAILDTLRTGSPYDHEYRIVRPDGSVRLLHARGEVTVGDDHKPARMIGCCWDITELRETMHRLKRARSLLEAAFEATADGLLVVDREGAMPVYNQQFLSLWRIPEDLIRKGNDEQLLVYVQEQLTDAEKFRRSTQELYTQPEKESFDVQNFKDGRVFERYSRPQRLGDQIVGRVWSFRDVTERERILRRAMFLADATRLLSSLDIEPALDSVAHLAIPLMGDACAIDLFGNGDRQRVVFVSGNGPSLVSPKLDNAVMAGHSTIYSLGARSCMAVPLIVKGTVAGAMTFISSPKKRYVKRDLDFADMLARRAALSVENARLYSKAQEALRARDEFLTIAAHEIRGPITSIHLAVQSMIKNSVPDSATPKLLEIIEREDRRLGRFVNELVDLGKIRNGQMYFNFEEVDLGPIVREAAIHLNAELNQSGSSLSITTKGSPVGNWDKQALCQVTTNLLANAIKFGRGKPIAVTVEEHEGTTTLEVQDHGIGIQPEVMERIFRPFERGVPIRNYGGLGLGLFIVHTIVEGLGGTIQVKSQPNEGSTFTVELKNSRKQS
jgi:signal transduction histidine kinase